MLNSIQGLLGTGVPPSVTFTILFIAILAVLILIWLARRFSRATLVSGGKQRQARLAVMDATPVDARRRLILVRRDDVEHLILIGGPTDVVVEQNIRLTAPRQAHSPQQMRDTPEDVRPAPMAPKVTEAIKTFDVPKVTEPRAAEQMRSTVNPPVRPQPAAALQPTYAPRPITPLPPRQQPPIPAPAPSAPRIEPIVALPERTIPLPIPVAAAVVTAPIIEAELSRNDTATKPELDSSNSDLEDSLFLDLSNEIGRDIDGGAPEISLEDERAQLLASIDTKREKPL